MAEFQALCHAAGYIWNSSDAVSSLPVLGFGPNARLAAGICSQSATLKLLLRFTFFLLQSFSILTCCSHVKSDLFPFDLGHFHM